jgi:nicotinate-nucleotide adenylyltransferase
MHLWPMQKRDCRCCKLPLRKKRNSPWTIASYDVRRPPIRSIRWSSIDCEIYYLIGEDNLSALSSWHRFDELQKLVRFAVLDRTGIETIHDYPVVRRKIDISASEIRKRVASGRSIRYLVPPEVEAIIRRDHLYREGVQ